MGDCKGFVLLLVSIKKDALLMVFVAVDLVDILLNLPMVLVDQLI
uniref:Uncharacterized protein n=1 Tax=viral metagenome TaxID=1070528 RepID=A0A6C0ACI4_9ZZZZ